MKSGGMGDTTDHTGNDKHHINIGMYSSHLTGNKASKDTGIDPSRNICILLDSDEEDDTQQFKPSSDHEDDLFSIDIEAQRPNVSTHRRPSPRFSPSVQILSSPSPPSTISRPRNGQPLLDTSWLSPPSPTHYDMGFSSPSQSQNRLIDTAISTSSPSRSLFASDTTNNNNIWSSLSPDRFDNDIDTPLVLSDNESVDSVPSPSKVDFSQMSDTTTITTTSMKRGMYQYTSTSNNHDRLKDKGKQVDTSYTSTSLAKRTFISDRLWEWNDDDNDDDEGGGPADHTGTGDRLSRLLDDDEALVDDSCSGSQEPSSQLSKKEQRKIQRQMDQEAKRRAKEEALRLKEEEARRKEQEKALARQLQQVNRLRKNRDELIKEMTVVVRDRSFMESEHGQLLRAVLLEKEAKIICQPPSSSSPSATTSTFTLTWRRDHEAEWDDERQQFIPFANGQIKSIEERAALVFITAESLVDMIHRDRVDVWIDAIQQSASDKQLFLMIEGLELYYKKKMNLRHRHFASTVMGNLTEESNSNSSSSNSSSSNTNTNTSDDDNNTSSTSNRPRKRKKTHLSTAWIENGPSRDTVEDTLTHLQLIKDIMLIQTLNEEDSVDWMVCLTTDLVKAAFNDINTASLCKGQGNGPRSGVDAEDVWSKMLQEIQNCTPAVAQSIVEAYPNPMALYQEYTQLSSPSARDSLLAHLEVQRSVLSNRDRTVNKFMSAKIHKIFMNSDPMDIIQ